MVLISKEVIGPGDYHTPEGVLRVGPRRLRRWADQFRRMKGVGLSVPVPWEHQDTAKPVGEAARLAHRVKFNAGWLARLSVNGEGKLIALLEVPDPADAERIEKNVRYVSPELEDEFTDGDGRVWKDVITHLALTTRPVNHRQRPFGAKVRMSYTGNVRLSQAQRCGMAQDKNFDYEGKDKETKSEDKHDKVQMAVGDDDGAGEGGEGGGDYLEECKQLLMDNFGIDLHESTSPETFLRDLCIALKAKGPSGAETPPAETEGLGGEGEPTEEQPGGSMMLSLEKRLKALEEKNQALEDQNATLVSERELARLKRYESEGRCSPAQAKSLRDKLTRHRLSLTKKNDAKAVEVQTALDCMAAVPSGTFWSDEQKAARLSHTREEKPRQPYGGGEVTAERAREAAAEQLKAAGYGG